MRRRAKMMTEAVRVEVSLEVSLEVRMETIISTR